MENPAVVVLVLVGLYMLFSSGSVASFNGNGNGGGGGNGVVATVANALNLGSNNSNSVNSVMNSGNSMNNGVNVLDNSVANNSSVSLSNATNQESEKLELMKKQNALGCTSGMNDSMVSLASNGVGNGNGGVVASNGIGSGNMVSINGVEPDGMSGGLVNGNGLGVPGVNSVVDNSGNGGDSSQLGASDLLPKNSKMFAELHPNGDGPLDRNFLTSSFHIGIDTVGQSLRNANTGLRSEPANPQQVVSPWNNTTIGTDLTRRPLETCE